MDIQVCITVFSCSILQVVFSLALPLLTFPTHCYPTLPFRVNVRIFSYIIAIYFSLKCFNKYASRNWCRAQVSPSFSSSSLPHIAAGGIGWGSVQQPHGQMSSGSWSRLRRGDRQMLCAMRTHVLAQCTICWSSSPLSLSLTHALALLFVCIV